VDSREPLPQPAWQTFENHLDVSFLDEVPPMIPAMKRMTAEPERSHRA
jgi:hypothetical protein